MIRSGRGGCVASPGAIAAALLLLLLGGGCLDPLVDDDLGPSGLILPAGSTVPSAHDDRSIDRSIDQSDGVDDVVRRIHGFAAGMPIVYRDFGPSPDFAAPVFILVRREGEGEPVRIDHPAVVNSIPGDPGYSPFRALFEVQVTDAYDGELLTSFAAVQEAERLGLVEAPAQVRGAINVPIVAGGVTAEIDGGELPATAELLWDGRTVSAFDLGDAPIEEGSSIPEDRRYVVRRAGDEPLSEVVRGIDLTGDGDTDDSNDVLSRAGDGASPLCRTVSVAVALDTDAIDTTADQAQSEVQAETDLFDPEPVAGRVVAYEVTDELRNCPQEREAGGL